MPCSSSGMSVRIHRGQRARRPAAEPARGQKARRAEAGVAVPCIAMARGVRGVLEQDQVVHHLGVAGTDVERAHPAVARAGRGNHEAAVQVRAIGRDVESGGHLRFQIRLAQRPAVGEPGRRGRLSRIAFGCSGGGPTAQHRDLRIGQFHLVLEARLRGQPRRHEAPGGDGGDQPGALVERPRRSTAGKGATPLPWWQVTHCRSSSGATSCEKVGAVPAAAGTTQHSISQDPRAR